MGQMHPTHTQTYQTEFPGPVCSLGNNQICQAWTSAFCLTHRKFSSFIKCFITSEFSLQSVLASRKPSAKICWTPLSQSLGSSKAIFTSVQTNPALNSVSPPFLMFLQHTSDASENSTQISGHNTFISCCNNCQNKWIFVHGYVSNKQIAL